MNKIVEPTGVAKPTPGQMIKAAREAKQISISEVVQKLLLSKQVVADLEGDDYSKISASVYAEGYLKAYAQFLQLPVGELLESFRSLNIYAKNEAINVPKLPTENKFDIANFLQGERGRLILLGLFGALALSVLVFFMVNLFSSKEADVTNVPNVASNTIDDGKENADKEQPHLVITNDDKNEGGTETVIPNSSTAPVEGAKSKGSLKRI